MKLVGKFLCCLFFIFLTMGLQAAGEKEILTQVSTLDALMSGMYDGYTTLKEMLKYGDTGLGTFQGLDGEMLVMDGKVYRIAYDGTISNPVLSTLTPYAALTFFAADIRKPLTAGLTLAAFPAYTDALLPTLNLFYAIRIEGTFRKIRTRSVPLQTQKPYLPLAEVVKNQSTFEFENIEGIIIGLRCPSYVKGINSPGYHLHFITKDKKGGGHVLDFVIEQAEMQIDQTPEFKMILPPDPDFYAYDFAQNTAASLQQVMQQPPAQGEGK